MTDRTKNPTLAEQLAHEVRTGHPERCRLRAYCGCEAARFVYGPRLEWDAFPSQEPTWLIVDACNLSLWLAGLRKVAWAPHRNVDPAHWVLTVAACGVARAVLARSSIATIRDSHEYDDRLRAIEAAEAWTREPSEARLETWGAAWRPQQPDWVPRAYNVVSGSDGSAVTLADSILDAANVIGPDAARQAAADAVLKVTV